jgi:hypothetical protein
MPWEYIEYRACRLYNAKPDELPPVAVILRHLAIESIEAEHRNHQQQWSSMRK